MPGKLLWCLFERTASTNCVVGPDVLREETSDQRFPEFRRTPVELRDCIEACMAGDPEWRGRSSCLVRRGHYLLPLERSREDENLDARAGETQDAAKACSGQEVGTAEKFLEGRLAARKSNVMELPEADSALTLAKKRLRLGGVRERLEEVASALLE